MCFDKCIFLFGHEAHNKVQQKWLSVKKVSHQESVLSSKGHHISILNDTNDQKKKPNVETLLSFIHSKRIISCIKN